MIFADSAMGNEAAGFVSFVGASGVYVIWRAVMRLIGVGRAASVAVHGCESSHRSAFDNSCRLG